MNKVTIIVSLVFVFLLSSCGEAVVEVPLVIYDQNDLYMQSFQELITDANDEESYTFSIYDSKDSQFIQNDILDNQIELEKSVLVVNPVDRLGVYPIIEKAKLSNTAIIFINREPLSEDLHSYENLFYVGAKPEQSAEYQADIVMNLFGNDPLDLNSRDLNGDNTIQCVILKGQPGHQDAEIRTTQVIDSLIAAGYKVEVLTIEEAYFSQDIAREVMEEVANEYGTQIEVVISNNDAMAIGAIETLIELEYFIDENKDGAIDRLREPWVPVIGIDGLPVALDFVERGYLYGTVLNDSQSMALAINELIEMFVKGETIDSISFEVDEEHYIWIDYKKIY